jgi:hypothetical protein
MTGGVQGVERAEQHDLCLTTRLHRIIPYLYGIGLSLREHSGHRQRAHLRYGLGHAPWTGARAARAVQKAGSP